MPMPKSPRQMPVRLLLALAVAAVLGGGAVAQILPGTVPALPSLPDAGRTVDRLGRTADGALEAPLDSLREVRLGKLLRANRDQLDTDDAGHVIVRDELIALAPSPQALERALAAGFRVGRRTELGDLGLSAVVLIPPRGQPARKGLKTLRRLDPEGTYDVNPVYSDSGEVRVAPGGPAGAPAPLPANARVGLLDSGVAVSSPAFAGVRVVQQGFTPGGVQPRDHGTAVASLLVGRQGPFHGPAAGAALYAADVYGGRPGGGSAEAIARALAWMARERVPVINVSLVGPRNALLEAAVAAVTARGSIVVAAVGNDGPAAPPLYPAAYPGVIAVTGVDRGRKALLEAGRGPQVAFAAPAADMAAVGVGGFVSVRGTSFAAPLVAGRLAALAAAGPNALARLSDEAIDLGAPGRDPIYGRGLVCEAWRLAPGPLRARPLKGG